MCFMTFDIYIKENKTTALTVTHVYYSAIHVLFTKLLLCNLKSSIVKTV